MDEDNDFDISKLSNNQPLFYSFIDKSTLLSNGAKETIDSEKGVDDDNKLSDIIELDDSSEEEPEDSSGDEEEPEDRRGDEEEPEDSSDDEEEPEDSRGDEEEPEDSSDDEEEPEDSSEGDDNQISLDVIDILKKFNDKDDDLLDSIDKTMNTDMSERRRFKKDSGNNWIQNFMKNKLYNIIDNEGGGDCLFSVIRDAFKSIDRDISVSDLRKIISKNADMQVFQNFKEQYDMYNSEIVSTNKNLEILFKAIEDLREKKDSEKDIDRRNAMRIEGNKKIEDFRRIKRENKYAQDLLGDYKWMENINTLTKFKSVLRTCDFWAEAWAMNLLESALNIKLIILSSENYKEGDSLNVLLCDRGFVNDNVIQNKSFTPKFYIITEYTGNHYKLITYGEKHIYTFNEIPYSIKTLIVEKCMEKNSGIYQFIPKFDAFKKRLLGEKIDSEPNKTIIDTPSKSKLTEMYNPTTVFQFYSKSNNKPRPGKGAGESIKSENVSKFSDLNSLEGWRKTLSNFFISPFDLDNHKWNSVEHYYQGSKFKKNNHEFYLTFSLDSGSELSRDPVLAKAYGGKTGKFKGKRVRSKEIKVDPDFFGPAGRSEAEMEAAQKAKYSQSDQAKKVLMATKDAKLVHYSRGAPPIVFNDIMSIRSSLL